MDIINEILYVFPIIMLVIGPYIIYGAIWVILLKLRNKAIKKYKENEEKGRQ